MKFHKLSQAPFSTCRGKTFILLNGQAYIYNFFLQIVPFRLTHNMVQAMGPTGYEGPFRIACEVALDLMRKQKDILISSLRPFVFDPLVSQHSGKVFK